MATSLLESGSESGPTLEEILSRHNLTEASLDKHCPRDIRNEIAVRLDDWEMVGNYLGFPRDKLRSIRRENDTEDLRKVALLDTWAKREGKGATCLKLARVLHQRQRSDIVDLLCEKLSSRREDTPTCGAVDTVSSRAIDLEIVRVHKRIEDLEQQFDKLHGQLVQELTSEMASIDSILHSLTKLPLPLRSTYEVPILKMLPDLERKKNIDLLFYRLNPLFTFIDCELLAHLISKFGSPTLREDMESYLDQIKLFKQQTTVGDLIEYFSGRSIADNDQNYKRLRAKIDGDPKVYTLEMLDDFRKKFCRKMLLSDFVSVLVLELLEAACSFYAVWLIPSVLAEDMAIRAPLVDTDFYLSEHIQELSLDGLSLYPATSMSVHKPIAVSIESMAYPSKLIAELTLETSKTAITSQSTTEQPVSVSVGDSIIDSEPTLAELYLLKAPDGSKIQIMKTVAHHWYELGILLDFDNRGEQLHIIDTKYHSESISCCRAMFQHWLNGKGRGPHSWRTLIELLEDSDQQVLAEEVRNALITKKAIVEPDYHI